MSEHARPGQRIAVVGTGISGMSAAWLLGQRHEITVFEKADRVGGHSNTVTVSGESGRVHIDTGFIVYNEASYPNLTALFDHLGVATQSSDMSFAVSLDDGRVEYSAGDFAGLFVQRRNLARPRFWSMVRDLVRFCREAPGDIHRLQENDTLSIGDYLAERRYGAAFRDDHLLPMACAIWSAPGHRLREYPAASFLRFQQNHGLLKFRDRPTWRTVVGGSQSYVRKLTDLYADRIHLGADVARIRRVNDGVLIEDKRGITSHFDAVVIAAHADQALNMLVDATPLERSLLSPFHYSVNRAVLHTDPSLMPRLRRAWSSWNYLGRSAVDQALTVTYWMNRLQALPNRTQYFVTLNPDKPPRAGSVLREETYEHPIFDGAAMTAQRQLWSLQGRNRTWFCGSYFGSGFHEDGLQAGLAVAEALGGVRRPWNVEGESDRIFLGRDQAGEELAA